MRRRHPVPTVWLMTDERIPDLRAAVLRLPRGAGVIFRHHATPLAERRRLFALLRRLARARGLVLVRAGAARLPGEVWVHGRRGPRVLTWPAHDRREAVAGLRAAAAAVLVSPVYPTRSHPGASALGALRARAVVCGMPVARVALGGMSARRFRGSGFDGWAAIDAWMAHPMREC